MEEGPPLLYFYTCLLGPSLPHSLLSAPLPSLSSHSLLLPPPSSPPGHQAPPYPVSFIVRHKQEGDHHVGAFQYVPFVPFSGWFLGGGGRRGKLSWEKWMAMTSPEGMPSLTRNAFSL